MAERCGVSERQLERFFADCFGKTPKQWMLQIRMDRARELIASGYTTKAAALEMFYCDASQFCRQFKRYFNAPPQDFSP